MPKYAAGSFLFPTGAGAFSVTGLDEQPSAVILFGGNKPDIKSLLTGLTGPGLFLSLNAPDYSAGTPIRSFGLSINGNSDLNVANYRGIENGPISMQTDTNSASTVDYKASAITFNPDGFTLTIATGASGDRLIHWVAIFNEFQAGLVKQQMPPGTNLFTSPFEPRSALVLSTRATNGFGENFVDNEAYFSFGSAHWPESSVGNPNFWSSTIAYTQIQLFSPLGRQAFTEYFDYKAGTNDTDYPTSHVIDTLGPLLVPGTRRFHPRLPDLDIIANDGGSAISPYEVALWWEGEGWSGQVLVPGGQTVVVNAPDYFEGIELVLFSTINGLFGGDLRFGFGLLHEDYQGCVVFGDDGSFYQSNDECAAQCSASGFVACTGVLDGSDFLITNPTGSDVVFNFHMFDGEEDLSQFFRVVHR